MLDLSDTTSLTFPAFVGFLDIEIVKPGPTVPLYDGVAAPAGSATASAPRTARMSADVRLMWLLRLLCPDTRHYAPCRDADSRRRPSRASFRMVAQVIADAH